jgi:hypothetical protein
MMYLLWAALFLLLSSIETASSFAIKHAVLTPVHVHIHANVNVNSRNVFTSLSVAKDDFVTNGSPPKRKKKVRMARRKGSVPNLVHLYTDYASRLWVDTNPAARKRIANDKAAALIRQVHKIVRQDDYIEFSDVSKEARDQLVVSRLTHCILYCVRWEGI